MAGLAAAARLSSSPGVEVILLESTDRVGGKLRTEEVAGVALDVGAESVLQRSPHAHRLLELAGLTGSVVHPEPIPAALWSRGRLVPLPTRTFMGVPADPTTAADVLDETELARAQVPWTPPAGEAPEDLSVAEAVGREYGRAIVDRVVEPLLGGVYAGRADQLSMAATMAPLVPAVRSGGSLRARVAEMLPPPDPAAQRPPMLMGLDGGVATFPAALATRLRSRGVRVETSSVVRRLERRPAGWRVITGPTTDEQALDVDAVVVAVPATPTSRLLRPHTTAAADALGEIESASMAVITLAVAGGRPAPGMTGSGFLVPGVDGRTIKASTFSSLKWAWVGRAGDDVTFLRASVGRAGDVAALHRDDAELVATAVAEVGDAIGHPLPHLVDSHVQRWGGGLPQYAVGHLDRVRHVREAVADLPGLAVAGAAYDGVGVAAVLASGEAAAEVVLAHLPTISPAPLTV